MILSLLTLFVSNLMEKESLKEVFQLQEKQKVESLESQKQEFLQILKAQPTHKDTLINLSIISCKLEDFDQCTYYYNQAKKLDPNDPFFKEFSPYGE